MEVLEYKLDMAKTVMLKEHLRKKTWIKVVIGETVLVTGVVIGIVTGAFIPVLMGVAAIELYLLVEGNYRLNIKTLMKHRREKLLN